MMPAMLILISLRVSAFPVVGIGRLSEICSEVTMKDPSFLVPAMTTDPVVLDQKQVWYV